MLTCAEVSTTGTDGEGVWRRNGVTDEKGDKNRMENDGSVFYRSGKLKKETRGSYFHGCLWLSLKQIPIL